MNSSNPHDNAWARLERNEIDADEFDRQFAAESSSLGHEIPGRDVLERLLGELRPEMVAALDAVRHAGFLTACLTNNTVGSTPGPAVPGGIADVMTRFDVVVESSKVGVRKPEPAFYELACHRLDVTARECVFLDDLGVNLKPAKAMGMTTIKVTDPVAALAELATVLGISLS